MCGVRSPRLAPLRLLARRESPKALSVTVARRSISGSLVGRGGPDDSPCSPAGSEDSLSRAQSAQTKPVRLMRLRDQIELTKEMTDGTVIYLSPHYRQLPASGVAEDADDITHNMYNELSMQFGALGIKIKSEIEVAFTDDQRALMLTVLCPGFFGNSELVEETARALRSIQRQKNATGSAERAISGLSGPRSRQNSGARLERESSGDSSRHSSGILRAELSSGLSSLSRRFSTFKRKPKSMLLLASTAISDDEYFRTCPVDLKELGLFDSQHDKWPESHWLQPTAVKTVIYKLPGHHHATRYERASDMLLRLGGRGSANSGRPTPAPARLPAVAERRERRASAADLGARRLSSGDCAALSPRRERARRMSRGSSSSTSMDEEMNQVERTRQWLSEEDSEERYQRERAAYRAMRKKGAGDPASPATLPRMPSLSKKAIKGALPPPPAALPPEERGASSSMDASARSFPAALKPPPIASEPMLDERGAAVPLARRDSTKQLLPHAPSDALEGARVSRKERTSPPLPSSSLLPGLSVGVAVHEPQRPAAPERMPSLSKKASKRALSDVPSGLPPDVPRCGSRESERGQETPAADEPHVMSSPRPECQKRLSGYL